MPGEEKTLKSTDNPGTIIGTKGRGGHNIQGKIGERQSVHVFQTGKKVTIDNVDRDLGKTCGKGKKEGGEVSYVRTRS